MSKEKESVFHGNQTIFDDGERDIFLSKAFKEILSDTKVFEDLFNMDPQDSEIFIKEQSRTIQDHSQSIEYSFPIYKLPSSVKNLSNMYGDVFFQHGQRISDINILKLNFEEHKEDLYTTLSGLIDQYSE